jgi:hypothetical protein
MHNYFSKDKTINGGNMEKNEVELVNRIYQDATVGMLAIDKILKKINNENLKRLFTKQFDMYEKFANKCDIFAINNDFEVKENSVFKKTKQTIMMYVMLWMDKTPRHIVDVFFPKTNRNSTVSHCAHK